MASLIALQVLVLGMGPWIWILSRELVSEAACDHLSCPSRAKALTYPLVSDRASFPLTQQNQDRKLRITAECLHWSPLPGPNFTAQAHTWGLLFGTSVETSELKLNWKPRDFCGPKDLELLLMESKWGPKSPRWQEAQRYQVPGLSMTVHASFYWGSLYRKMQTSLRSSLLTFRAAR